MYCFAIKECHLKVVIDLLFNELVFIKKNKKEMLKDVKLI